MHFNSNFSAFWCHQFVHENKWKKKRKKKQVAAFYRYQHFPSRQSRQTSPLVVSPRSSFVHSPRSRCPWCRRDDISLSCWGHRRREWQTCRFHLVSRSRLEWGARWSTKRYPTTAILRMYTTAVQHEACVREGMRPWKCHFIYKTWSSSRFTWGNREPNRNFGLPGAGLPGLKLSI